MWLRGDREGTLIKMSSTNHIIWTTAFPSQYFRNIYISMLKKGTQKQKNTKTKEHDRTRNATFDELLVLGS